MRILLKCVTVLALAMFVVTAMGQRNQARRAQEAEARGGVPLLERYQDRPWMSNITLVGPAGGSQVAGFNSTQVNVNGQGLNIVNDAANEPSLCVDPTNPNRIAVGWRQFDNKSSNFRQGGWAYTTNHGQSWTFPGVLENNVFRSDPVLASDADGRFYYLSLMQTFFDDIWLSLNGGIGFTRVAAATGGDKQWFTIDRTNGIGHGHMYQSWSTAGNNYGGRQFSRSTDAGATWSNPINIPFDMVWGTLDTNAIGDLYLCGTDGGSGFYFARSSNAKDRNQSVTFDVSRTLNLNGSIIFGAPINPAGLGGQTWIACDKSGGPTNGYLYVLASVSRNSNNPGDVMLTRSTDGGNSWNSARRINDDATGAGKYHWFGTLSVAPNGRVDVCWYDTRNSANNSMSELWYTYSTDGGTTFAPNIRISNQFNHSLGYPNQNKIGDYIGMVSDNAGADVAYAATFNGEQDVYYVRIEALPETALPDSVTMLQGTQISGGANELNADDANYLVTQSFYIPFTGDPVRYEVTTHTMKRTPSALQLKFDGRVSHSGLTQKLAIFNYQTNEYEVLDSRPAPITDAPVNINATGDLSRFINQATGEVRARVSYSGFNPATLSWRASSDMLNWIITP